MSKLPKITLQQYDIQDQALIAAYFPYNEFKTQRAYSVEVPLDQYVLIRRADAAYRAARLTDQKQHKLMNQEQPA